MTAVVRERRFTRDAENTLNILWRPFKLQRGKNKISSQRNTYDTTQTRWHRYIIWHWYMENNTPIWWRLFQPLQHWVIDTTTLFAGPNNYKPD